MLARCSVVERFNVDCLVLASVVVYLFIKLFSLSCSYTRRLVGVATVFQVGLLRDSSFYVLHARMGLSWLCMELMPSVGIVLN